jgi:PWI domain
LDYIEQAQAARGDEDPIQKQARLDAAKGALASVLADLTNPSAPVQQSDMSKVDNDGDPNMATEGNGDAEVVTIPLTADDELSDIPAEMRETVAREIAAFRDRSNRRDLERLRREEEAEAMDRRQGFGRPRSSRLASPPATLASGGANGLPSGPREKQMPNAPAGPKGHGSTAKAVSFVNGTGLHGAGGGWIDREDEDSEASDEELEWRRQAKKDEEQEKRYLDQERKWLNRERSRTAALEREKNRDKDEASKVASTKEAAAKALADLDEDAEAKRGADDYHIDRSQWIRNRAQFRAREANLDDMDRAAEERERARDQQQQQQAIGMADDFLSRQAAELDQKAAASNEAPREPQRFKLSLGAAAQQKAQQAASSNKRTVAEVEGLLEDEEEENATTKRTLVPIKFDSAAEAAGLTEEERQQAVRQLAAEIPTDKEGLWAWQIKWDHVDEAVLSEQLRPFVEKKIVEYLGVQEQMLVEAVEEHVRKRGGPSDLVELLEGVSFLLVS